MSIPIRNLYFLLCYAWQHVEESDIVDVDELEPLERTQDLFGKVLSDGTFRLLRRGIDRGYLETRDELASVRGKLAVSDMAKRALRARCRTACIFEELTHDIPHNRILRSTLGALLQLPTLNRTIRSDVRLAYRKLQGISEIRLDRQAFRQIQLDRNRRLYRFLISLCELICRNILVDQSTGESRFIDVRDDYPAMWRLFEDFVIGFYSVEQDYFMVNENGRRIPWHDSWAADKEDLERIPAMEADVILESTDRRIILDTKFYDNAFGGRWNAEKLHSNNLYQLLCYLQNRQARIPYGPRHEGILLYPVVKQPLAVDVRLNDFRVQARGIDLARDWRTIHQELLEVIGLETKGISMPLAG